jgi:hypothetical protein
MKQLKGLKRQAGFLGNLLGAVAPTLLGGLLGGDEPGSPQQVGSQMANPFDVSGGLFGTSFQDGNLQMSLDPQLQQLQQSGLFGAQQFMNQAQTNPNAALAGQLGEGFLGQLGTFNPMDVAQQQFGLLNPMLQEQFTQDRLGQESRQFAQGRLGSTGGAQDVQAMLGAQEDARRNLLFESYGQGLQGQQHLFNLGSGLSQLDPQLRGLFGNLANQALNVPLSLQQAGLNQAQIAGGLAGGAQFQPQQSMGQALGAGLINSGVQGLTGMAQGLFSPPPNMAAGLGVG